MATTNEKRSRGHLDRGELRAWSGGVRLWVAVYARVDRGASDCPVRVRSSVEEAMSSNLPPSRRR
jgi:hypothetical protein